MRRFRLRHQDTAQDCLSSTLIYPPGSFASTEEIIELARVAAEHDGICISHMRNEARGVLPLHTAIHKMTRLPADRIRLADRGRLSVGAVADIVAFDPEASAARAGSEIERFRGRLSRPLLKTVWTTVPDYPTRQRSQGYRALSNVPRRRFNLPRGGRRAYPLPLT